MDHELLQQVRRLADSGQSNRRGGALERVGLAENHLHGSRARVGFVLELHHRGADGLEVLVGLLGEQVAQHGGGLVIPLSRREPRLVTGVRLSGPDIRGRRDQPRKLRLDGPDMSFQLRESALLDATRKRSGLSRQPGDLQDGAGSFESACRTRKHLQPGGGAPA